MAQPLRQRARHRFVLRAVAQEDVLGEFRVAHGGSQNVSFSSRIIWRNVIHRMFFT